MLGTQADVILEADSTDGKLLAFIESHARVSDRQFEDGRVQIRATVGRRMLAELERNEGVTVTPVDRP